MKLSLWIEVTVEGRVDSQESVLYNTRMELGMLDLQG